MFIVQTTVLSFINNVIISKVFISEVFISIIVVFLVAGVKLLAV
jgi:hypothetical protein